MESGVTEANARLRVVEMIKQEQAMLPYERPSLPLMNWIVIKTGVLETIAMLNTLKYEIKEQAPTIITKGM